MCSYSSTQLLYRIVDAVVVVSQRVCKKPTSVYHLFLCFYFVFSRFLFFVFTEMNERSSIAHTFGCPSLLVYGLRARVCVCVFLVICTYHRRIHTHTHNKNHKNYSILCDVETPRKGTPASRWRKNGFGLVCVCNCIDFFIDDVWSGVTRCEFSLVHPFAQRLLFIYVVREVGIDHKIKLQNTLKRTIVPLSRHMPNYMHQQQPKKTTI